jgi:hypothetical protein
MSHEPEKKDESQPVSPSGEAAPSDAAKLAAAATDKATQVFKANMAVGVFLAIALIAALVSGIIKAHTTESKAFAEVGVLAAIIGVAILFIRRIMPSLRDGVIKVTNEAFGKVLGVVLNVIFVYALVEQAEPVLQSLCGSFPRWLGQPISALCLAPLQILQTFLKTLSLEYVAGVSLCAFVVAVIAASMFLKKN